MDGAGVGSRGEAPEAQNFKAAQWKGPLSSLLTQYVAMGEQYRSHLGAYQKCWISGPAQNLHFNEIAPAMCVHIKFFLPFWLR